MNQVKNRQEWIFSNCKNILESKDDLIRLQFMSFLNKTSRMFKYSNLPKTIPAKDLETILQLQGYAIIAKDNNGDLYAFSGGLGGEPNPYYLPTLAVVANPSLRLNKNYVIDKECIVMLNDSYYQGLAPLINKYSNLLVECELSLKQAVINARIPTIVEADNDSTKASAEEFFDQIVNGGKYGVVMGKQFFEGLKSFTFNTNTTNIKDIIEVLQYLRATFYNEIGLNAQFNMKREAINSSESTLNDDVLFPTIDTMLECRKKAVEDINNMYGTNISVEFDSVWALNELETDLELEKLASESKAEDNYEEVIEDEVNTDTESSTDTESN